MKSSSYHSFLAIGAALLCLIQFPINIGVSSNPASRSLVVDQSASVRGIVAFPQQGSLVGCFLKYSPAVSFFEETRFSKKCYYFRIQNSPYDNFFLRDMLLCLNHCSYEHEPVHKPPWKIVIGFVFFCYDNRTLSLLWWRGSFLIKMF